MVPKCSRQSSTRFPLLQYLLVRPFSLLHRAQMLAAFSSLHQEFEQSHSNQVSQKIDMRPSLLYHSWKATNHLVEGVWGVGITVLLSHFQNEIRYPEAKTLFIHNWILSLNIRIFLECLLQCPHTCHVFNAHCGAFSVFIRIALFCTFLMFSSFADVAKRAFFITAKLLKLRNWLNWDTLLSWLFLCA